MIIIIKTDELIVRLQIDNDRNFPNIFYLYICPYNFNAWVFQWTILQTYPTGHALFEFHKKTCKMKVLETLRGDKDKYCMTGFKTLRGAIYKLHRRVNRPYMALYSKLNFLAWRRQKLMTYKIKFNLWIFEKKTNYCKL